MSPATLSRILSVKRTLRQVRRAELADAEASVDAADAHRVDRERQSAEALRAVAAAEEIEAGALTDRAALATHTHRALVDATHTLDDARTAREVTRERVVDATSELRVTEKLSERTHRELARVEERRAQGEQDDAGARKRGRT